MRGVDPDSSGPYLKQGPNKPCRAGLQKAIGITTCVRPGGSLYVIVQARHTELCHWLQVIVGEYTNLYLVFVGAVPLRNVQTPHRADLEQLAIDFQYQLITDLEEFDCQPPIQAYTLSPLRSMSTSTELSQDQIRFFADNGFIVLNNVLSPSETKGLQEWAQEVHDLPRTSEVPWMPYEVNRFSNGTSTGQKLFKWLRSTFRKSMLQANEYSAAPRTSLITTPALITSFEAHVSSTSWSSSLESPCFSSKRRSITSSPVVGVSRRT